ncbi:MAG: Mor transcription activator family protein [Clostridia bacterium]|nr:Mor transcription activator family protein [Clostridia bacterium]
MRLLGSGKDIKSENLNGVYSEIADLLGVECALQIHSKYRGTQMFFPVQLYGKEFIVDQIISEYDGKNIRHLATKYGYTEKWIRKILKDHIG